MRFSLSLKLFFITTLISLVLAMGFAKYYQNFLIEQQSGEVSKIYLQRLEASHVFFDEYISQIVYDSTRIIDKDIFESIEGKSLVSYVNVKESGVHVGDEGLVRHIEQQLRYYADTHSRTENVYLGLKNGDFISASPYSLDAKNNYDPRVRPWYQQAVSEGKVITLPLYWGLNDNSIYTTIASPIYDEKENLIGVVGIDISYLAVAKDLISYSTPQDVEMGLYIHSTSLLKITNAKGAKKNDYDEKLSNIDRHISIEAVDGLWIQDFLGEKEKKIDKLMINGESNLVIGYYDSIFDIYLYFRIPMNWIEASFFSYAQQPLLILIIMLMLISLTVMLTAQILVVHPVTLLARSIKKISEDPETALQFPRRRKDEIQKLQNIFLKQFKELADHRHDLEKTVAERTEELEKNVDKLQIIADYGYDWECWIDPQGRVVWMNPAVTRLTGYTVEECSQFDSFLAQIIANFGPEKDMLALANLGMKEGEETVRMLRKDQTPFWAAISWRAIYGEKNKFRGVRINIRDVTEITELNRDFTALLDNARDCIYFKDTNHHYRRVSQAVSEFFGIADPQELLGRNERDFFSPEDAAIMAKLEEKVLAGEEIINHEQTMTRADGEVRWLRMNLKALRDSTGQVSGLFCMTFDITKMRLAQERLTEAKRMAEEAAQLKGDFLANMSHEIRTPMNAIIGLGHMLSRTSLDLRQLDYVKKIERSAKNLLGIINDILDFSKIEAGKMVLEAIPFSLIEVINDMTSAVSAKIQEKGLELIIDIASDVPLRLVGDPLRLGQVLINLASNSAKYTETGEIRLEIQTKKVNEKDLILSFIIIDTGIGIEPEKAERLFQAFSQADNSITRKYGGTGLGLSIVRTLVRLMGGGIGVRSVPGEGSRFQFTAHFGIIIEDDSEQSFVSPAEIMEKRVLVVDDNDTALHVLSSYLRSFSMNVEAVSNGKEALGTIIENNNQGTPFSLVFLDWRMPGWDGSTTARQIQDLKLENPPKIVMITAYGRENLTDHHQDLGIDAFLIKPVSQSVLYNTILELYNPKNEGDFASTFGVGFPEEKLDAIRGTRILVVEDNSINREIAREILTSEGFFVEEAVNGREAVEILKADEARNIDLVLLDLQMPILDGFSATREIRQDLGRTDIPIVALTADVVGDIEARVKKVGMNDVVTKPINIEELFSTLEKYLSKTVSPSSKRNSPSPKNIPPLPSPKNDTEMLDLPGINFKAGVQRLRGNLGLYKRLLKNFANRFSQEMADWESLIAKEDFKEIESRAHTLKGAAGNLGMSSVMEQALHVEGLIKDSQRIEIAGIQELKTSLTEVIQGLEELSQKEEEDLVKEKGEEKKFLSSPALLNKLKDLLDAGDAEALDCIELIAREIGPQQSKKHLQGLRAKVEDFDFEGGLITLQTVRRELLG